MALHVSSGVMARRRFLRGVATSGLFAAGTALLAACGGSTAAVSTVVGSAASTGTAASTSPSAAGSTVAAGTTTAQSSSASVASSTAASAVATTSSTTAASAAVATSAATQAPGTSSGVVSVLYYTSTDPAIQRMKKQETAINTLLPQIKLTMIPTPSDIDTKFTTMAAGGSPPDVAWMGTGFWEHAPAGELLTLDSFVAGDKTIQPDTYYPQALDLFRYQGHYDALPYGVNTHVMVYNKGMLQKAGVPFPTEAWTYDDYVALAKRLTSSPDAKPQAWGEWMWNLWVNTWMFGGQFYDKDFTKSLLDQPPAIAALQFYYDQSYGKFKFAPQSGTYYKLFGADQLALTHVGPFSVPVLRTYQGADWDFLPMPWMSDKTRGTWLSGEGYAIAAGTKNKDGAWAVLKYLCGRDSMANFYTPEFQAIPAVRDVAESAFVNAIPGKNAKAFLESIDFATAYGGNPVVMKWGDPINAMWTSVQKGQKSAQDAAKEAAAQLNVLLKAASAK
jgi:multiple sugar transport system substrate-binding protein